MCGNNDIQAVVAEPMDGEVIKAEIFSLPTAMRHDAAVKKYAEAVRVYSETEMPLRDIALQCEVSPSGLSAYIGKYHRDLLLKRYGIESLDLSVCVKKPVGQSSYTYHKYRSAIDACSDMAFIEYNVSQIARMFGHNVNNLTSQLHLHYQDVIPERERIRQRLGLADNNHRGVRPDCTEAYAAAVNMYRNSDMTIPDVAEACGVSPTGFSQHLRFYHKAVIDLKASRRRDSKGKTGVRRSGTLSGNGQAYGPKPETMVKYAAALELYRTSFLTVRDIVRATGVPYAGFRGYLRQWHRGEILRRRGYDWDGDSEPDIKTTKQYLRSTAGKYANAIESLKANPRHVTEVAAEFGLNPDVFREYLQKHEPDLAASHGMIRRPDGKLVKRSSAEKYAKAIEEYASSAESLRSIAGRNGLVYNSLMSFVLRNCHAERDSHLRIVKAQPVSHPDTSKTSQLKPHKS